MTKIKINNIPEDQAKWDVVISLLPEGINLSGRERDTSPEQFLIIHITETMTSEQITAFIADIVALNLGYTAEEV